jgi:hypothetical protein
MTASWEKKRATEMKKTIFLFITAMAILFYGCSTDSSFGVIHSSDTSLINSNTHPQRNVTDDRGICLPITARSSLNVDVECILEYVQKEASVDATDGQTDLLYPWIRLDYSF